MRSSKKNPPQWLGIAAIAIPPLTLVAVTIAVIAVAFGAGPDYAFTLSLVLDPLALMACGATTAFSIAMWGYGGDSVKHYRIATAVGLSFFLLLILTAALILTVLGNAILSMG